MTEVCQNTPHSKSKLESVYALLKRRITDGIWQVGERIPTEVELARELDCSRSTIGLAIARLVNERLVERRPRLGTRVTRATSALDADPTTTAPAPTLPQLDAYAYIYPSELHEGIFRTVQGFQLAARDENRRVVTLTTGADYKKEAEFVGRLPEFDVKGAVMNPLISAVQEQALFANVLRASRIPIVLAGALLPGSGCPCAMVDSFHAGYTVTKHLVERGARKIGFLANHAWIHFMTDRHQGYRWALRESGLSAPERGIRLVDTRRIDFTDPLAEPTELARAYLANLRPGAVDAVVCADDHLATGLIRAALERGLRVPRDLRIVGIGDLSLPVQDGITLTSYQVPYAEIGRAAFQLLETCVNNRHTASDVVPDSVLIEGRMVARASSA